MIPLTDWLSSLNFADYVVLGAGVTFCVGYAIINQVILRLLILAGTGLYIWYYAIVTDVPQWAAIWTSVAMGLANIFGLFSLWLRSSPISIPARHRDIYTNFQILPPGDFRKLMSAASRQHLPAGTLLTRNNARVKTVYYVINGTVAVDKFGDRFYLPDGIFLGEVGYLTGNRASATTFLIEDSEVLAWDVATLTARSERDVRFKLAMDAIISLDLAEKVARAGSPRQEDQITLDADTDKFIEFSENPAQQPLHLPEATSS